MRKLRLRELSDLPIVSQQQNETLDLGLSGSAFKDFYTIPHCPLMRTAASLTPHTHQSSAQGHDSDINHIKCGSKGLQKVTGFNHVSQPEDRKREAPAYWVMGTYIETASHFPQAKLPSPIQCVLNSVMRDLGL